MHDAGAGNRREVDQDRLVLARGKAQVRRDRLPPAVLVLRFERQSVRLQVLLSNGDVDAAVGRINPTVGDQPMWWSGVFRAAELRLDKMIAGDPLVFTSLERREILAVA